MEAAAANRHRVPKHHSLEQWGGEWGPGAAWSCCRDTSALEAASSRPGRRHHALGSERFGWLRSIAQGAVAVRPPYFCRSVSFAINGSRGSPLTRAARDPTVNPPCNSVVSGRPVKIEGKEARSVPALGQHGSPGLCCPVGARPPCRGVGSLPSVALGGCAGGSGWHPGDRALGSFGLGQTITGGTSRHRATRAPGAPSR